MGRNKRKDLFCLYYINFNKVFEIAMLLDNQIITGEETQKNSNHSLKLAAKIKNMLAMVFEGTADIGYNYSKGSQLKKTVEIKMTNSVVLKDLIEEVKLSDKNIENAREGKLILIDDVNLSLVNEEETRQIKLVKQGVLDRFIHEDISLGEIMKPMLNDYSYQLTGKKGEENYLIKIPANADNEFENNYTIDDLLLGKVTLIGIYNGLKSSNDLKNTFTYLKGNETQNDGIIDSQTGEEINEIEKYHYIDILAITQKIHM
ncbi:MULTISPECIES: hypothetical protein [Bacillus cereus group]|uniref:hypothetical protein n=1 Tax=Bacillus cereus group TaxID=86661 RepID=UPI000BF98628|nr:MULTISPECIES: hypothetical protein [Bacillus cereus group]PFV97658.1 hypothetical protein COL21_10885 [Bacillus thuringiensis]PGQ45702.1 hypothetical protein COA20_24605 [Bacillus thuringiensis]PGR98986.1 hypothetical protein COC68_09475 [Bacillus thuringiensis]QFY00683.1 hypothetical protein GE376_15920 [Bacillus cereus]